MHSEEHYDAVIVGGGHNGLTAAGYLARAGRRVLVLERLDHTGGAAVSERPFPGVDARLSRYSYLVSLLPQRIIDDLGLDVRLARRRYSSYTPDPLAPGSGLLVDNGDDAATTASLAGIGAEQDATGLAEMHRLIDLVARTLWPTMTEPLRSRTESRAAVLDAAASIGLARHDAEHVWSALTERPIGELIARETTSDLVRGVVLTDALIGTFARASDAGLQQNICFLYHLIGGGTGDWDVPIGGMGAVTDELARAAREAGAEIRTSAEVTGIEPQAGVVHYRAADGSPVTVTGEWILSGAAPHVLDQLIAAEPETDDAATAMPGTATGDTPVPEGAQVKVNLLVKRLPRLLDPAVDPAAAFGGTFHVNEGWGRLDAAYREAESGRIPEPLPLEIYCHTLSDPSILSPALQDTGAHTLTVFGLHVPHRLALEADRSPGGHDSFRDALTAAVLRSLAGVLAEPIEELLLLDADGHPCIETRTTLDLERSLAMPGGNIFHGPLSWPFLEDDAARSTPAERWGVATTHPRVLVCGAGARRGGAVSGLGGHNAAMAVLEQA